MFEEQMLVARFCKENDLESDFFVRLLDVMSELGEFSKEILKGTDYGKKDLLYKNYRGRLNDEIGDLIFSIFALANSLKLNLDDALKLAMKKYEKRLLKGSPGSEND